MEELPRAELAPDRNEGQRPWSARRRLMYSVVAFSMVCIVWALYKDTDTQVMQTAVASGFATISAVTGAYVFGAVWSDKR